MRAGRTLECVEDTLRAFSSRRINATRWPGDSPDAASLLIAASIRSMFVSTGREPGVKKSRQTRRSVESRRRSTHRHLAMLSTIRPKVIGDRSQSLASCTWRIAGCRFSSARTRACENVMPNSTARYSKHRAQSRDDSRMRKADVGTKSVVMD